MQLKDWLVNKDSVPVLQPFADWTSVMQASKSVARTASSAAEQLHYSSKNGVQSAPRTFRNGSTGGLQITPRPV